jgi:DNA-binding transcriptional MocR family regulator
MRLLPVRTLARQLDVNQITVAKAYRELSEDKLIEGRRGGGSFVCRHGHQADIDPTTESSSDALLAERLFELARASSVIALSSNYPMLDDSAISDFRDCMAFAMEGKLPACFRYDPPLGRPESRRRSEPLVDAAGRSGCLRAVYRAVRRGVAFVAGDVFYSSPSRPQSLRIWRSTPPFAERGRQ